MRNEDTEEFRRVMDDLCTAFNRPCTDSVVRVFFESLKYVHIGDVKRAAHTYRKHGRRFPSPSDLIPAKRMRTQQREEPEPELSKWACIANKVLWFLVFRSGRGLRPIGKLENPPNWKHGQQAKPLDDTLARVLAAKADYVRMAEQDERDGRAWNEREFIETVHDGLKVLLVAADKVEIPTESTKP